MANKYSIWGRLVCSILSVNKWEVGKTLAIYNDLEKQGLFDFDVIIQINDIRKIGNKLKATGYDRGALTYIISERLLYCAKELNTRGLNECEQLLSVENADAKSFLQSLHGIGPKTIETFYSLA